MFFLSSLKAKIDVGSVLHDSKEKQLTPRLLRIAELFTTFFTLITGGCNWFMRHGR
jgi:hypothetical protein